jgi:Cu(I)/Ag(I) efflux system membrane fusion protein
MAGDHNDRLRDHLDESLALDDGGGLHAPPELTGWRKAWWWFDFIILVKLARLRFIGILLVIGVVITQWDALTAYYDKWTRPADAADAVASDVEYFCPMHPSIIRDNPKDKCPICFMPLSKRKKGGQVEALPAGVVNRVQLTPYRVALAGVNAWPVDYVPLAKEISAAGYIEFNERGQKTVSARVAGRIDKLFADETGEMVQAGDPLASLYSPDLFVTVQNLREAQQSGNRSNLESAKTRLKLQGIDDAQIEDILAADVADSRLLIRSPISGHIITKYVREGDYVEEGTRLYDLADLSSVWIQAPIYEDDLAFLPVGDDHGDIAALDVVVTATTRAFPDQLFVGKLAFLYPHADQQTRTVIGRFELENPGHRLRPGGTATVTLNVPPKDVAALASAAGSDPQQAAMLAQGRALAVPESSVIDTGSQRIVYRESSPGVYEGVEVSLGPLMTGPEGGSFFPVLRGLAHGDLVVTSGSFLVDAETRLNPAAGSIYFGGSGGSQNGRSSVTTARPTTPEDPDAKIEASLAKLSPEDRQLAESQQFCPVLPTNRLGVMGVPEKVTVKGEPVFLCCAGCKDKALKNPEAMLTQIREFKAAATTSNDSAGGAATPTGEDEDVEERAVSDALGKLDPEDRGIAEAQRFCAVLTESRLGSMGPPVKVILDGQQIFLCCAGCTNKALNDPEGTLARVAELKRARAGSSDE